MGSKSQGNARPHKIVCGHSLWTEQSARRSPDQHICHGSSRHDHPLAALEARIFPAGGPHAYVLIDPNNVSPRRVGSIKDAHAAIDAGEATSAAGVLAEGLLAADVDAECHATGDGITEKMAAWCTHRNLPHLIRLSGRPGGRHVIVVASRPADRDDWAELCRELTSSFRTSVTDRTGQALRLLSVPHRLGLPSPIIRNTIVSEHLAESRLPRTNSEVLRRRSARKRQPQTSTGVRDTSRSADEWGDACVLVRRNATTAEAWAHIARPGSKAAERGRHWWLRYAWLPAVTTVAAEAGMTEDAAWEAVRTAAPATALKCGRRWWKKTLWARAVDEATTDRPRRQRLSTESALSPEQRAQIDAVSSGLRTAADETMTGLDPRVRNSILATLGAIAGPIVLHAGAASLRFLAERGLLDRQTVRASLERLCAAEVLIRTGNYEGGTESSDAYGVGPAAQEAVANALNNYSPTRCTTPAPHGRASKARLLHEHSADRSWFRLRTAALAALPPGESLRTSQHPLARAVRSRWVQRRWWTHLTPAEQEARRTARRRRLGALSRSDLSRWFDWLAVRGDLVAALDGALGSRPEARHVDIVQNVRPLRTFHRGLQDPDWRDAAMAHARSA